VKSPEKETDIIKECVYERSVRYQIDFSKIVLEFMSARYTGLEYCFHMLMVCIFIDPLPPDMADYCISEYILGCIISNCN
jgi:hypothetical protein